jgi:hypothetical protein
MPWPLHPWEESLVPTELKVGLSQSHSGWEEKDLLAPALNGTMTLQFLSPWLSHYMNYIIQAHIVVFYNK